MICSFSKYHFICFRMFGTADFSPNDLPFLNCFYMYSRPDIAPISFFSIIFFFSFFYESIDLYSKWHGWGRLKIFLNGYVILNFSLQMLVFWGVSFIILWGLDFNNDSLFIGVWADVWINKSQEDGECTLFFFSYFFSSFNPLKFQERLEIASWSLFSYLSSQVLKNYESILLFIS